jgi:hypothetical protein
LNKLFKPRNTTPQNGRLYGPQCPETNPLSLFPNSLPQIVPPHHLKPKAAPAHFLSSTV